MVSKPIETFEDVAEYFCLELENCIIKSEAKCKVCLSSIGERQK